MNPRPADYKTAALPTELHQHKISDYRIRTGPPFPDLMISMVHTRFNLTPHGVSDYWRSACFLTPGRYIGEDGETRTHTPSMTGTGRLAIYCLTQLGLHPHMWRGRRDSNSRSAEKRPVSFQDCSLDRLGTTPHVKLWHIAVLMERIMGIEPTYSAWKADILPLNYIRMYPAGE